MGDGTTTDRSTPIQVADLSNVIAIGTGYYHSLALKNSTSSSTISGTASEAKCNPLEGVTVTLLHDGTVIGSATSGSEGNYALPLPSPGTYQLVAEKAGFRTETQDIAISGSAPVALNFTGDHSLVPNAPDMSYALGCVSQWLYPTGECSLSMSKALSVVDAWLNPVE